MTTEEMLVSLVENVKNINSTLNNMNKQFDDVNSKFDDINNQISEMKADIQNVKDETKQISEMKTDIQKMKNEIREISLTLENETNGVTFRVKPDGDFPSDTDWTPDKNQILFAPDVVCRNGKYYLYAYIVNATGCVAVSDRPEGPFTLLSKYKYTISDEICCNGWFIDPGVLPMLCAENGKLLF